MLFLKKDRRRVRGLVQQLGSRDGATRVVAELELLRLAACRQNILLAELDREIRCVRHLPNLLATAATSQLTCFSLVHLVCPAADPASYLWPAITAGCIALANLTSTRNAAARLLSRFEDGRLIEPLARALLSVDEETRPFVSDGLLRLLKRRPAEDARNLTCGQLTALSRCLRICDPDLALVIMAILVDASEISAIPAIAAVARGEAPASTFRVQAHASDCLKQLTALADSLRTGSLLLRPAASPDNPMNTLVRPAASPFRQANAALLRLPTLD